MQVLDLVVKVRGQREKGEEVEGELGRQLSRLKGEVGDMFFMTLLMGSTLYRSNFWANMG